MSSLVPSIFLLFGLCVSESWPGLMKSVAFCFLTLSPVFWVLLKDFPITSAVWLTVRQFVHNSRFSLFFLKYCLGCWDIWIALLMNFVTHYLVFFLFIWILKPSVVPAVYYNNNQHLFKCWLCKSKCKSFFYYVKKCNVMYTMNRLRNCSSINIYILFLRQ